MGHFIKWQFLWQMNRQLLTHWLILVILWNIVYSASMLWSTITMVFRVCGNVCDYNHINIYVSFTCRLNMQDWSTSRSDFSHFPSFQMIVFMCAQVIARLNYKVKMMSVTSVALNMFWIPSSCGQQAYSTINS